MRLIFSNIAGCPEEEMIKDAYRRSIESTLLEQKKLEVQMDKDTKQLETLRLEIANALTGNSTFSADDLSTAIQTIRNRIEENTKRLDELQEEAVSKKTLSDGIIPAYKQFRTWALEFDESSLESKRMIVSQLFNRIEVGRDYKVHFFMNFTYKQFCDDWMTLDKKINATA